MSIYTPKLQQHIEAYFGGKAPSELKAFLDAVNQDYMSHEHGTSAHARHTFLSSLSHEVRTPMNSILGMSELLLSNTDLPPSLQENLFILHGAAHHLLNLFNDILDFSRLEAGKLELDALDFNVTRTLENALDAVMFSAQRKGVEVLLDIAPEVPNNLNSDPGRLRQVVQRLLEYTLKLIDDSELWLTVQIAATVPQQTILVISLRSKIAASQQTSYMQMFQSRPGQNYLGLTVCMSIIELLGGELTVHPEDPYTVVQFSLPCHTSATQETQIAPPDWQGRKVMIADTSAGCRSILKQVLSRWGLDVIEVASSSHFQSGAADAVIAEVQLADAANLPPSTTLIMHKTPWLPDSLRHYPHLHKPLKRAAVFLWLQEVLGNRQPKQAEPGLEILLVEDNPVNQKVAILMLRKLGHSVDVADDGQSALDSLADKLFDVILMDVQMPTMDGLTATRMIRIREAQGQRFGKRGRIPIVAMTANALRGDREKCLAAGMDSYVSKPVSKEVLSGTISEVLQSSGHAVRLPVMDLRHLTASLHHNHSRLNMLIKVFLEDLPAHMEAIHNAVQAGNATTIARESRALHNALMSFDAQLAAQAAEELESVSESGNLSAAEMTFNQLQTEIERLRQALSTALLLEVF